MARNERVWARRWSPCLAMLWLLPGCVSSPARAPELLSATSQPVSIQASAYEDRAVQQVAHKEVAVPEGPYSLEQLIALAFEHHPELRIAQARADAARGKLLQAGLYPNPMVGWEADELGHNVDGAGEQGPFISQEIVTGGKLQLAEAAAAYGVSAADWQAVTRRHDLVSRIRMAYYEVLAAQREVKETQEVLSISQKGVDAAKSMYEVQKGNKPDILRAQIELEQARIRLATAQRRLEAARKLLAVAVGMPELPMDALDGSLDAAVPQYEWQPLAQTVLTRSSEVQEAQATVLQMQQEIARAYAENIPNLDFKVRPFYAFPDEDTRLMVEVGARLPIFNRNQGNIVAAHADLTRAAEEARQVDLRLLERLTNAFQRYQTARLRVDAYQRKGGILQTSAESLDSFRTLWESGHKDFTYTMVLDAQRTLVQARLDYVQALGELWRAISEIRGLLQEDLTVPGGVPCQVLPHR